MLVLEVQLPQQEAMKKIEWDKEVPRFYELKNRIQEFGVPDDWCVEVMRENQFMSPDENVEICGDRITMRVAPILGRLEFQFTCTSC